MQPYHVGTPCGHTIGETEPNDALDIRRGPELLCHQAIELLQKKFTRRPVAASADRRVIPWICLVPPRNPLLHANESIFDKFEQFDKDVSTCGGSYAGVLLCMDSSGSELAADALHQNIEKIELLTGRHLLWIGSRGEVSSRSSACTNETGVDALRSTYN